MAVIDIDRLGRLVALLAASLIIMSFPAYAGDDDKAPAYMIYIDPETGKYTTTRPHSVGTADAAQQSAQASDAPATADVRPTAAAQPTSDVQRSNLPLIIAGASVLAALLVAGVVRTQRKQFHSG
jgi:hypothetical protein